MQETRAAAEAILSDRNDERPPVSIGASLSGSDNNTDSDAFDAATDRVSSGNGALDVDSYNNHDNHKTECRY